MESLYEHAGGAEAWHRLIEAWYESVLADPLLIPLFGKGSPTHVISHSAFDTEVFGGPDVYTREHGGFSHLIDVHRGLKITEEQRQRFVELYMAAADTAGLPDDKPFRQALREHAEFGTQVAMQNSNAETDADLHPLREMPQWRWPDETG
jgi:hemoglobin